MTARLFSAWPRRSIFLSTLSIARSAPTAIARARVNETADLMRAGADVLNAELFSEETPEVSGMSLHQIIPGLQNHSGISKPSRDFPNPRKLRDLEIFSPLSLRSSPRAVAAARGKQWQAIPSTSIT
eukprot:879257-Amorphochlora_amoeboformis.AAC.1